MENLTLISWEGKNEVVLKKYEEMFVKLNILLKLKK